MPEMDARAILHSAGFMFGFAALIVGSFVLAAHFGSVGDASAAFLLVAVGLAIPVLIGLGMGNVLPAGIACIDNLDQQILGTTCLLHLMCLRHSERACRDRLHNQAGVTHSAAVRFAKASMDPGARPMLSKTASVIRSSAPWAMAVSIAARVGAKAAGTPPLTNQSAIPLAVRRR